jgi:trk system potassium uptake protein TrkA
MKIIIAGVGNVGFHLAKMLSYEDHNIILIDTDNDKLKYAANHLDISTIKGSSTSIEVLENAGVAKADLVIAVTSSEEINITTSLIAKSMGAAKVVARISNYEFLWNKEKFDIRRLGIDEIISPATLAAKEIKRLLKETAVTEAFEFDKGLLKMIGVTIEKGSKLEGARMLELPRINPDQNFVTMALLRNNETIIPGGAMSFEAGDYAYFVTQMDGVDTILALAGKQRFILKDIMIMGGSSVGINAARSLCMSYNVKLIESNVQKAEELADTLPNVMVINGDGRNADLLIEEGLKNMDAFIAVTGNSETNILSCLLAKKYGVKKTIALVENIDYIHISQNIGVDTLINKKLIAASFIFRYIRKGEIVSLTSIHGVDAEVLEFEVKENSVITKKKLRDLNFPTSAKIGGVVREGRGYTTLGDFAFQPKDRVVVLTRPECVHKVESFFK